MRPIPSLNYLAGYDLSVVEQVWKLIEQNRLAGILMDKYPHVHAVRNDRALYDYVQEIKDTYLRNSARVSTVLFDSTLQVIRQSLGIHSTISRVQGVKLKSKREIRVASVFKVMPLEFLRMIVVHELAHLKEQAHDKAFYQLCRYMEPDYHQLEFDLRVYLCYLDVTATPLWSTIPVGGLST